jgi:hypothetical protein
VTHVPTVLELVQLGLAKEVVRMVPAGKSKKMRRDVTWWISPEGHEVLGAAMRDNAAAALARGEGDWVQPPSRGLPALAELADEEDTGFETGPAGP